MNRKTSRVKDDQLKPKEAYRRNINMSAADKSGKNNIQINSVLKIFM